MSGEHTQHAVIGFLTNREGLRLDFALVVLLCILATLCAPVVDIAEEKDGEENLGERALLVL